VPQGAKVKALAQEQPLHKGAKKRQATTKRRKPGTPRRAKRRPCGEEE